MKANLNEMTIIHVRVDASRAENATVQYREYIAPRTFFGYNNNRSTKIFRLIVIAFPTAFSFVRIFMLAHAFLYLVRHMGKSRRDIEKRRSADECTFKLNICNFSFSRGRFFHLITVALKICLIIAKLKIKI